MRRVLEVPLKGSLCVLDIRGPVRVEGLLCRNGKNKNIGCVCIGVSDVRWSQVYRSALAAQRLLDRRVRSFRSASCHCLENNLGHGSTLVPTHVFQHHLQAAQLLAVEVPNLRNRAPSHQLQNWANLDA